MSASGVKTFVQTVELVLIDRAAVIDHELLDFQSVGDFLQAQHLIFSSPRGRGGSCRGATIRPDNARSPRRPQK